MILSIALGIVLAVVILHLLPVMLFCIGLAGAVAYQVVRGILSLISRGVAGRLRGARYSRSVQFGLFLSAIIAVFSALVR